MRRLPSCLRLVPHTHERWSRSGQNNSDLFHKFVPATANGVISAAGKALLIMFHAIKVGKDSEVGDLLSFTLSTVPDGICFASLASRENPAMDGGIGDEVTPRSNMKRSGKRRNLSTSEKYLPREGIMSSDYLHSSISSALEQLRPERQNQMSEKAERIFYCLPH
jgi:hypothetical protein